MKRVLIALIKAYRTCISPWLGQTCRFHPTCSRYAMEALERYGALRGSWLAFKRVLRCHPFHAGGVDPVPQQDSSKKDAEDDDCLCLADGPQVSVKSAKA